ncbi:hypothetical protein ACVWYH_003641 [Bradyrhizobium sp. GM24.11]
MEFGNSVTIVILRNTVRLAWATARVAQALGALGDRLEHAVERQAHRRQVNIADVLEPLIAEATA